MVPESHEVINEVRRRGNKLVEYCDYIWTVIEIGRLDFERGRKLELIDQEYMGQSLYPLPADWPKAVPGNGQPLTIGQIAHPGPHRHPWGVCGVAHEHMDEWCDTMDDASLEDIILWGDLD